MKKLLSILTVGFMFQLAYAVIPVAAQGEETAAVSPAPASEDKDVAEVKAVVENYLQCIANSDMGCAMGYVSKNFSAALPDRILDSNGLTLYIEDLTKNMASKSVDKMHVLGVEVAGGKAIVDIEYEMKGFSLRSSQDVQRTRHIKYSLVKEDGAWKIISLEVVSGG